MEAVRESPIVASNPAAEFNRPLRILHYIPGVRLEQGGVVRAILDWCTVLSARGNQMTVVTYGGQDLPRQWLDGTAGNPRAYVVDVPFDLAGQLNRKAMVLLDRLMQEADVLHLHGPWLNGNRQVAKLARRHGVPYLVSTHGMLDDWPMSQRGWKKRLYMAMFGRSVLDHAACIHCTADTELSQTKKWFGHSRTAVLPYVINLDAFENLPGPELGLALLPADLKSMPKALFLSRISDQKGVDLLIKAAGLMRDKGTSFVLMIAGTGFADYENEIRSLVTNLHLKQHVIFLGLVTGQQKLSLYQSADLFILSTRHENFGLVLIEAMACGTAVLTTRGTDIWRDVQSAGAEIVDSTPQAIAAAATAMLANPADCRERGKRGREWVLKTFAIDSLSQQYESLYRRIAAERKARS